MHLLEVQARVPGILSQKPVGFPRLPSRVSRQRGEKLTESPRHARFHSASGSSSLVRPGGVPLQPHEPDAPTCQTNRQWHDRTRPPRPTQRASEQPKGPVRPVAASQPSRMPLREASSRQDLLSPYSITGMKPRPPIPLPLSPCADSIAAGSRSQAGTWDAPLPPLAFFTILRARRLQRSSFLRPGRRNRGAERGSGIKTGPREKRRGPKRGPGRRSCAKKCCSGRAGAGKIARRGLQARLFVSARFGQCAKLRRARRDMPPVVGAAASLSCYTRKTGALTLLIIHQ